MSGRTTLLAMFLVVQAASAVFFIGELVASILGLPPLAWSAHELIEIAAGVSLAIGVGVAGLALRDARRRSLRAETALHNARADFRDMLAERFEDWALTPAESDVAMMAIKGFSTAEMAEIRGVSEGTIKAQTAAIYRKAGVTGRPQLLSVFIDDLIETDVSA